VLYLVDAAVFVKGSKVVADENRRVRGSWATEGYPTSSSAGGTTGTDSAALRSSESGSADVREGHSASEFPRGPYSPPLTTWTSMKTDCGRTFKPGSTPVVRQRDAVRAGR
jgi:hypothetical protein